MQGVTTLSSQGLVDKQRQDSLPASSGQQINDLFLKLLVAQVKNQDPLKPTDSSEYVSQMAQMTQVQSIENMSQIMANNAVLMDNLQVLSTATLVGKEVMIQTNEVKIGGEPIKGRLTLDHSSGVVNVLIKDMAGSEYRLSLGKQSAGQSAFTLDPKKLGIPPGNYTLSVVTDQANEKIPVEISGVVTHVRVPVKGGQVVLNIPGIGEAPVSNVSQFGKKSSS